MSITFLYVGSYAGTPNKTMFASEYLGKVNKSKHLWFLSPANLASHNGLSLLTSEACLLTSKVYRTYIARARLYNLMACCTVPDDQGSACNYSS